MHDYLVHFRGGELVLQCIASAYPDADIFTFALDRQAFESSRAALIGRATVWPRLGEKLTAFSFRHAAPLFALAAVTLDLAKYDLVISSTSAFAHWVRPRADATHVVYMYTPLRYAWGDADATAASLPSAVRPAFRALAMGYRMWDRRVARRLRSVATSSSAMHDRIRASLGIRSLIIPPPAELSRFTVRSSPRSDFFLTVGHLVRYKRFDIAIEACNQLGERLVVVGEGPERGSLERIAGSTISFTGPVSDTDVCDLYQRARALILPTEEDYGITALEAQACGTPVIAFGRGGALDTVVPGTTGEYFSPQTPQALSDVLRAFDGGRYQTESLTRQSLNFSPERFVERFRSFVDESIESVQGS